MRELVMPTMVSRFVGSGCTIIPFFLKPNDMRFTCILERRGKMSGGTICYVLSRTHFYNKLPAHNFCRNHGWFWRKLNYIFTASTKPPISFIFSVVSPNILSSPKARPAPFKRISKYSFNILYN